MPFTFGHQIAIRATKRFSGADTSLLHPLPLTGGRRHAGQKATPIRPVNIRSSSGNITASPEHKMLSA